MSCGNGTRRRARLCNSPTPDNGGKDCIGQATEYEDCVEVECPGNCSFDYTSFNSN